MSGIEKVYAMVLRGKAKSVELAVKEALAEGCNPEKILNQGMIEAMDEVGRQFKEGKIFVPEMLVAARAMKKGVEILKPCLVAGSTGAAGKAIIGTVAGDLHDIGKNLVAMMLESAGFEVLDLGSGRFQRKICKGSGAESGRCPCVLFGAAHDDDAGAERYGFLSEPLSVPEKYKNYGRRRSGDADLRRGDWGGRLYRKCRRLRTACQRADERAVNGRALVWIKQYS